MNYSHPYHAGNFADVVKHAVVARIVEYLKRKEKPFRAIDTHAGVGIYDLDCEAARRTGEADEGIRRVWNADFSVESTELLAPYLDSVAGLNNTPTATAIGGPLRAYPGSPLLMHRLMRDQDRLVVNELHADDKAELAKLFVRDRTVKVLGLDGWTALKSLLPVPERRGVVLIDPPFEVAGEFDRLVDGVVQAAKKFAGGIFVVWYPIKDPTDVARFHRAFVQSGLGNLLGVEVMRQAPMRRDVLNGTGLIVHNPPFTLKSELEQMLPELAQVMGTAAGADSRVFWLAPEFP